MEFEITTLQPTPSVEANVDNPMIDEDLRDSGESSAQESQNQHESIVVNKPRREIRRLARYNVTRASSLLIVDDNVPSTHRKAVMCSEANK